MLANIRVNRFLYPPSVQSVVIAQAYQIDVQAIGINYIESSGMTAKLTEYCAML